ncbi:LutC/YkgG family protein [Radicibacter daui]|uniref:LutC/YkgG family protein n=1 Tax=Radicibacter daui TaxID=3064829 RepID=UPI004046D321
MTSAREEMLARVRRGLAGRDEAAARSDVDARLERQHVGPIPAIGTVEGEAAIEQFITRARAAAATVERLAGPGDVPAAVADYLAGRNLAARARISADLAGLGWERTGLDIVGGKADPADTVSVVSAEAAIAETGTLLLISGAEHSTAANFLPETHLVVVPASRVVGSYELAWKQARARHGLPRTLNFITGPSRTGDIEQRIQLGAHGPRNLHIMVVGDL